MAHVKHPSHVETFGTPATMTPFLDKNSSSRNHMGTTQIGQAFVPGQSDLPLIFTGFEDQLAEYTFGCRIPCDLTVVRVINKYTGGMSRDGIADNPLKTVIYQNADTWEYGVFHIESFQNQYTGRFHETFSFRFKPTPNMDRLHKGATFFKGEVLTQSPNITPEGLYSTSLQVNVISMNTPYTTEDGFEVCETLLERAAPLATGQRSASWGRKKYPLNLYYDPSRPDLHKSHPEIGEHIRADGLVFALREYDELLGGLDMTRAALRVPDFTHDDREYGKPGAKVVDITVLTTTNENNKRRSTPAGMDELSEKYSDQHSQYYMRIIEVYEELKRANGRDLRISPELQNLITIAYGDKPNVHSRNFDGRGTGKTDPISKVERADKMDEWNVTVTYEYKFKLAEGAKLSDFHGGKGVVCKIRKREDMPRDEFGNIADAIVHPKSSVSRLNGGRDYERLVNAFTRDVRKDIIKMVEAGERLDAYRYLVGALRGISTYSASAAIEQGGDETVTHLNEAAEELLDAVVRHNIHPVVVAGAEDNTPDLYVRIMEYRPPDRGRITYRTVAGDVVSPIRPMTIWPMNMIFLEKCDNKPMAVNGVRRQHHGLTAPQTKGNKHSRPTKEQAPRVFGETEKRGASATMGGEAVANTAEITSNPDRHREAAANIYKAENPARIDAVVDRENSPKGSRALRVVSHIIECAGIKFSYQPPTDLNYAALQGESDDE